MIFMLGIVYMSFHKNPWGVLEVTSEIDFSHPYNDYFHHWLSIQTTTWHHGSNSHPEVTPPLASYGVKLL